MVSSPVSPRQPAHHGVFGTDARRHHRQPRFLSRSAGQRGTQRGACPAQGPGRDAGDGDARADEARRHRDPCRGPHLRRPFSPPSGRDRRRAGGAPQLRRREGGGRHAQALGTRRAGARAGLARRPRPTRRGPPPGCLLRQDFGLQQSRAGRHSLFAHQPPRVGDHQRGLRRRSRRLSPRLPGGERGARRAAWRRRSPPGRVQHRALQREDSGAARDQRHHGRSVGVRHTGRRDLPR